MKTQHAAKPLRLLTFDRRPERDSPLAAKLIAQIRGLERFDVDARTIQMLSNLAGRRLQRAMTNQAMVNE